MTAATTHAKHPHHLALPASLLVLALGAMAVQVAPLPLVFQTADVLAPPTVTLPAGNLNYRAPGVYMRNGAQVDAPLIDAVFDAPVVIMQNQVSAADYGLCVADGACQRAEPVNIGRGNVPVTGVNYNDAVAYAGWLSARTGQSWTLPTDAEWAYAAGERFTDDALGLDDGANPALRWLADYNKEAARNRAADPPPRALGSFGANSHGVIDMAGNVWEWTDSCYSKTHIDAAGTVLGSTEACTIRMLNGQHRAPMSTFVRDAKSGGCSVGTPPDNLGFRLVRRPAWYEPWLARLGI
ncbi:formylglycine-generating enzyme family protein [Devosia sp. 63-57]|uniref:formylglycine-generating enzyme family protein n=1 Tax=Devosia sp. 63-57 TaxID=1895751 RepID=UPI00086D0C7F|nr:formylglycine-generating enzyme family protein [Devosia sp. 63-57]ODT51292.1 MAG: hypothetical protein ABS74_01045 [Pelagibacterium sp. SCN 63-126]ODU86582.1 MAG: hypothetical protein ABT14_08060 [Pelagibacterium sp. SCN 63-17]OJX41756.1 MAG: hypothetical protein BGO80_09180 [Devosia sp. 63-57]